MVSTFEAFECSIRASGEMERVMIQNEKLAVVIVKNQRGKYSIAIAIVAATTSTATTTTTTTSSSRRMPLISIIFYLIY
jgi:hypothetical protein